MALKGRLIAFVLIGTTLGALVAYLHDPPWLVSVTSGMRPWETDLDGHRLRWMGGHASLFVPSDARLVSIPIRTTFNSGDPPVTATISIDDRPVDRVTLTDAEWRLSTIRLPPKGSRRARRVDIRVDRTRADNRGAAVGEVTVR
jgi:hypothetical protein